MNKAWISKLICSCLMTAGMYNNQADAQVINIERARMQSDTTGWLGNAGAAFSLTRNTRQVFAAEVDAQLQYKSARSLYLIAGNYGLLRSSGTGLIDNGQLHLRYNYKVNNWLRWEAFTQWQQNSVTRIGYRYLAGTGPRFKCYDKSRLKMYAGCLLMFEAEKEMAPSNLVHHDARNSSYFSFTFVPAGHIELIGTVYYQPLLKNLPDYRLLNQVMFRLRAGKFWAVRLNWNYLFDSHPVSGIPRENYTFSTGIDFDL